MLNLLLQVLYVFAIASVELIGKHSDFIDDPYVQERFGTLVDAMFTLFQVRAPCLAMLVYTRYQAQYSPDSRRSQRELDLSLGFAVQMLFLIGTKDRATSADRS